MADELAVFKFINPPGTGPIIRIDDSSSTADFMDFQKASSEVFSVDVNGLPDPGGGDPKRQVYVSYGDLPADADSENAMLVEFEQGATITNIYICADASTVDGSINTQTFAVKRSVDDAAVCSWVTSANPGLTLKVWQSLGAISNAAIGDDAYIYCTFTKAASGLAVSGLTFLVEYTLV